VHSVLACYILLRGCGCSDLVLAMSAGNQFTSSLYPSGRTPTSISSSTAAIPRPPLPPPPPRPIPPRGTQGVGQLPSPLQLSGTAAVPRSPGQPSPSAFLSHSPAPHGQSDSPHLYTERRRPPTSPPLLNTRLGPSASDSPRGVGAVGTPLSPYASNTLSPFAAQSISRGSSPMALRAPSGPVVEYNPQQWGHQGPTGGAYVPHSTLAATAQPRHVEDGGMLA
jgi:hypothetical protein